MLLLLGCGSIKQSATPNTSPAYEDARIVREADEFSAQCHSGPMDAVCALRDLVSIEVETPDGAETVDFTARVTLYDYVTGKQGASVGMDYQPPKPAGELIWPDQVPMEPGTVELMPRDASETGSTELEWEAHDVPAGGITYIVSLTVLPEIEGSGAHVALEMTPSNSGGSR